MRVLQGATSRWLLYPIYTPDETGSCRSRTDPQYCGSAFGNDPGRAVFIGATGAGRPQALQILNFPRHLLGSHSSVNIAFVGNNRAYNGTSVDFYPKDGALAYYFGEGFFGAETVVPTGVGVETSPTNNSPVVNTTNLSSIVTTLATTVINTTSTTTVATSRTKKSGGSTSWLLFMLPALTLLRRLYKKT